MATVTDDTLLQENIEEYVNDDNKIVSCKWLSLNHSININVAKRALHTFVDHQRNKGGNDDINVTYFVAGLGTSKDGEMMHKCAVVPETELDVVKKSLSVLTSCHIFSVQKAKLKDYTPLYMTDYDIIKNNIGTCSNFSSIKCPWVTLKSATSAPPKTTIQNVPVNSVKPEKKENSSSSNNATVEEQTKSVTKTSVTKAAAKGSIASMFAAAGKKDSRGDKVSNTAQKADTAPKTKAKEEKKQGMMAFFTKSDSPTKKTGASTGKNEPKKAAASKVSPKDKKADGKRKEKQANCSDDEEPDRKRRRRIKTDLFDSSDEEDNVIESEEEEEPEKAVEEENLPNDPSPDLEEVLEEKPAVMKDVEPEQVEEVSGTSSGKKRKRTKKVVTNHYQDEEGFMVTKKETVWESETDEEAEEPVKKESPKLKPGTEKVDKPAASKAKPKTSKKTNISPQKGKQTSLTSFFKRK